MWLSLNDFYLLRISVPSASQADIQRIRDAIRNATSLAEVERLTRILQSGNIPQDLHLENSNGNGSFSITQTGGINC